MGAQNKNYEKTIPTRPSERRELKEELEFLVFKKQFQKTIKK